MLNVIALVTPLVLVLLTSMYSTDKTIKLAATLVAIGIVIIAEYFRNYRPLLDLDEVRKGMMNIQCRFFLVEKIGDKNVKLRANVMRIHWHVFGKHFFQVYEYEMEGHPDEGLHFAVRKGFCSKVVKSRNQIVHYIDLKDGSSEAMEGWSAAEEKALEGVTAILSVPLIRRVRTIYGTVKPVYYGCFNVDALDKYSAGILKDPEFKENIRCLALQAQVAYSV